MNIADRVEPHPVGDAGFGSVRACHRRVQSLGAGHSADYKAKELKRGHRKTQVPHGGQRRPLVNSNGQFPDRIKISAQFWRFIALGTQSFVTKGSVSRADNRHKRRNSATVGLAVWNADFNILHSAATNISLPRIFQGINMIRSAGLMICLPPWGVAFPAARSAGQGPGDLAARLTHDDYPDLIARKEAVSTIAVSTVLAVEKRDGRSWQTLGFDRSVERLFETTEKLRQPPNPVEWREAAISAPMAGWTRFPPAEQWLKNYSGDGPFEGGNQ